MGSGHSTRKLTIANDEELGVIHISNGVAQRLAHGAGNPMKESPTLSKDETCSVGQLESGSNQNSSKASSSEQSTYYGKPAVHVHPEYTISALKMQQQKEEELNNQNLYWQRRLENLKDNHAKIDHILEEEYQRAINQVSSAQGTKKIDLNSVIPPCIENKDKVLRCYNEHPKEILKCSSLVEEFSNCVDQRRAGIIAARC